MATQNQNSSLETEGGQQKAVISSPKVRPHLSIDGKQSIEISVHLVPITTMMELATRFGVKPEYRNSSATESYSVIELNIGNLVLTFYSIHLHKPWSDK